MSDKINLRKKYLPKKKTIKVLDLFGGYGEIWDNIQKDFNGTIHITRVEKRKECGVGNLIGDNMKFLPSLQLSDYDIIDIDAYGIPFNQIDYVLSQGFKGEIFITFIHTFNRTLPKKMLFKLGYTEKMIKKNQQLFSRNRLEKLKNVLSLYGIKDIQYIEHGNKVYAHIKLNPE